VESVLSDFASALDRFQKQRFAEAAELFEAVLATRPEDGPAAFYLERCRQHLKGPPPEQPGVVWLVQK
jgi:cytochrome c-type biogenesis protein CcmH/NrfG